MASSSSSTNSKNSRPRRKLSKNEEEEEPPQKMSKHFSNNNNIEDYVSSCTIDSIPDDILSDILKMVPMSSWPKLQRINRQFNRSILLCWRGIHEIEFKKSNFHVPVITKMEKANETEAQMALKSILKMLASYSPRITSIIGFNYFVDYLPKSTLMEISAFKYIKVFNFSKCEIRPEYLSVVLTDVATHLTELNISQCLLFNVHDTLSSEAIELRRNNDLKLIDAFKLLKLTKFYFDNNYGLYGLFLEHLDASSITTVSVVNSRLNAELFANFLTRCHALTSLDISKPRFTYKIGEKEMSLEVAGLAPSILSSLSSSTHIINNLKTLKMDNICIPYTQTVSQIVRQHCERGFTDLFTKLINLRELSLNGNEYTFKNIITVSTIDSDRFRNLQRLHLPTLHTLVGNSLILKLIKNMKKLERLFFHSVTDDISNQIIIALTSSPDLTKSLRYLKLDRLHLQDPNMLSGLSMFENLTGLSVDGSNVTNDVLLSWGPAFDGRLEILELPYSSAISDASFSVFVQHLSNLIRLNLYNSEISDVSLRALSIFCPKLMQLNLASCKNITAVGVQNVIDSCHRLEVLVLQYSAVKFESLKVNRDIVSSSWDYSCCFFFKYLAHYNTGNKKIL